MAKTFRDMIRENKRKSVLLVAAFCLFVAIFVILLAIVAMEYFGVGHVDWSNWQQPVFFGLLAGGFAFLVSLLGYYAGDSMVLGIAGAQAITKNMDPQLFNVVEEMALAAGLPMPKVYLIPDPAMNAFATGRGPESASVAITTGLRSRLNREELEGVIAHEMAHIRNYDIRLMLLVSVLVGTVVMLADFFWQALRWGPDPNLRRNDSSGDKKQGGNPIQLVMLILAIVFAILAPILARIIQMAISRQREYLADASAVQFTRNPTGLADALRTLEADPTEMHHANRGIAHLFIVNPIKKFNDWADTIFSSHPPTPDRIRRLEALVAKTAPAAVNLPDPYPANP